MPDDSDHEHADPTGFKQRLGLGRRPLLKLLGAGAGIAAGSGTTVASTAQTDQEQDQPPDQDTQSEQATIDPQFGYPIPADEDIPADIDPDHTVRLLYRFPEGFPPEEDEQQASGDGGDDPMADGDGNVTAAGASNEPAAGAGNETMAGADDGMMEDGTGDAPMPGDDGETAMPSFDHPPFFVFDPTGLHVEPGDVVEFAFASPDHTVTAYHPGHGFQQRVPDGVPPVSSPLVDVDGAWLYRFDEPGVYDLYCAPHHLFGMVMRIVVGDLAEEDLPDYIDSFQPEQSASGDGPPLEPPFSTESIEMFINAFAEQESEWPFLTPVDVLTTDALAPMALQDEEQVAFSTVAEELGYSLDGDESADGDDSQPTVQVRVHDDLGEILVGPDGLTLYMFDQDTQGEAASACYDGCAEAWPPLTTDGDPTAGDDVTADLETFERDTGETQVMAGGWPLYYYAEDQDPGDIEGQGVNGVWWALQPDGTPIRDDGDE